MVADTRALAEDAAEAVEIDYEPLPFVLDAERGAGNRRAAGARGARQQCAARQDVRLGRRRQGFRRDRRASVKLRVKWGRSSTVPIETFGVVAAWDPWREMLDVYASIQMPRYADQIGAALKIPSSSVRVHYDVDVGGSYGVKRGIKHTVLCGYLARRLGCPDATDRGPAGKHARRRRARAGAAVRRRCRIRRQGIVRSMKMRALENVGAYAGRSPFQLGKPIGAIVGPYKIKSVAVPGHRGRHQQDHAGRGARLRPGADQSRARALHGRGRRSAQPRSAGSPPAQSDPARGIPLPDPERHHLRQRQLRDRHRQGAGRHAATTSSRPSATGCAREGRLAGIGIAACLEPSGGNATFEALLNPKITTIDLHGFVPHQR